MWSSPKRSTVSRASQEDIAHIYKRAQFAGVRIVTLSEGEVSELHIGLKGTMGALFLKDLAGKTRRGLRGRVEAGKSGGGLRSFRRARRRRDQPGLGFLGMGRTAARARAAPCRTFAFALTQTAAGGEIDVRNATQ